MTDDRIKTAYHVFRGGFRPGANMPPHWTDLEPWVRDALVVAYLQGKLDGSTHEPAQNSTCSNPVFLTGAYKRDSKEG